MCPAQTKQEDVSDPPREQARKIFERRWNVGTESPFSFHSNQFRLSSEGFFCLVIHKEMLNRSCQLCLLNTMCAVGQRQ